MNRDEKLNSLEDGAVAATDHQPHVKFDKELGAGYNIYLIEEGCGATGETPEQSALGWMMASSASQLATLPGLLQRQCDWTELGHFSNRLELLTTSRQAPVARASSTPTQCSARSASCHETKIITKKVKRKTARVVPQQT